jgi:hypothetical protein
MGDPTSRPGVGGVSVSKEIGTSPTRANGKERQEPTVATDHGPATRPEWNDGGTQDGLDIMISGVQSGKVDVSDFTLLLQLRIAVMIRG